MFTSAKSGANVEEVFNQLAKAVSAKQEKAPDKSKSFALGAGQAKSKNKGCC